MKKQLLMAALASFFLAGVATAADPATKPATGAKPATAAKPAAKPAAKAKAKAKAEEPLEDIPPEVRDEMSKFVEQAIQLASPELQTADTFQPYGVLKLADGSLKTVRWQKPNPPPAMEIFRRIYFSMAAEAKKNPQIIAGVTIAPSAVVTVDGKTQVNGIRAEVDHRNGIPRVVFMPYMRENGKPVFGTTIYQPGQNALFERAKPATAAPAAAPAAPAEAAKKP